MNDLGRVAVTSTVASGSIAAVESTPGTVTDAQLRQQLIRMADAVAHSQRVLHRVERRLELVQATVEGRTLFDMVRTASTVPLLRSGDLFMIAPGGVS